MTEYTVTFTLSEPISQGKMHSMIECAIDCIDPAGIIESVTIL